MSEASVRGEVEERHAAVLSLSPDRADAVRKLLEALGDTSWRVRKAASSVVHRFTGRPELVGELIAGLAGEGNIGLRNGCADALRSLGEHAVDPLITALRTPDAYQRKFVAEILGGIGTPRSRHGLLAALEDPDDNVRASVAEALGNIGGSDVLDRLRERLRQADPANVLLTAYLLDALARARAQLPLDEIRRFGSEKSLLRHVQPLLGLCADARACDLLVAGVRSSSRGTRHSAIAALARLQVGLSAGEIAALGQALRSDAAVMTRIREAMNDEQDEVARAAVELLGLVGDPALAPQILAACANRAFLSVGVEVVHGMGNPAVDALTAVLYDVDPETRVLALEVVEMHGDASKVPICLGVIGRADRRSAEAAIRALGRLGGMEVVDALISVIEAGDEDLTPQATLSLAAIGRRNRHDMAQRLRRTIDGERMLPSWLTVLGVIGRDADVPVVLQALSHRDASVRAAALSAAAEYGDVVPLANVVLALADESAVVRAAAARALGGYRGDHVEPALLAALRDPDPWVVAEAARALGAVGGEATVTALLSAAASSASPIAIAALQALFRSNPVELEGAVRRAVRHADPEVVHEAIRCMLRLPDGAVRELLVELLEHRAWDVRRAAAESLANRRLQVPADILGRRLDVEDEELVKRSLERLVAEPAR